MRCSDRFPRVNMALARDLREAVLPACVRCLHVIANVRPARHLVQGLGSAGFGPILRLVFSDCNIVAESYFIFFFFPVLCPNGRRALCTCPFAPPFQR
jgi:hypothetical protein